MVGRIKTRWAKCHPERKHFGHGLCSACYQRKTRGMFKSQSKEYVNRRYSPEKRKAYAVKKYGLSVLEYTEMITRQNNKCAICGSYPDGRWQTLCIDHDHQTGKVRALLCVKCNRVVGLLKDSVELAEKLVLYLAKFRKGGKP